jgi:PAS domain S-box-containing protein
LLGYTEKELRTIDFVSLIHPEDREANLVHVRRLQVGEIPSFEIENRYVHKNGEPVWVRKFVSVLHGEEGERTHLIALVTNVTERKRAEEAIKESEQRFRLVADSAPVMIWMSGLDKNPTYFNRPWLDFTGQSEADLQSGLAGIVHPEDYSKCPCSDLGRNVSGRILHAAPVFTSRPIFLSVSSLIRTTWASIGISSIQSFAPAIRTSRSSNVVMFMICPQDICRPDLKNVGAGFLEVIDNPTTPIGAFEFQVVQQNPWVPGDSSARTDLAKYYWP